MGPTPLRTAARIAVVVGALGAIVLMLYAGRGNPSSFLLVLFAIWNLSPFVGLAFGIRRSSRWPMRAQTMLSILALVIAIGSLGIYGAVVITPIPKVARVFLMVPLLSWILILLLFFVARRSSGGARQSQ